MIACMHRPPITAGDGSRGSSSSPVGCWSALSLGQRMSTKKKSLSASIIIFAALSALIGRNLFGLDLRQYSILHDLKKGDATERLSPRLRRYSKFTPIANEVEGASQSQSQSSSSSLSWSLPNTTFTPHISALVEFFKRNRQSFCQPGRGSISVTVKVDSHNSMPIFTQAITKFGRYHYRNAFEKLFHRRGSSSEQQPRFLPAGNLTIAMSKADFDEGIDGMCQFANSAAGGRHCVFNMQAIQQWDLNETYPSSLPWNERESIPVFRGQFWGGGSLKRKKIKFDHNVLESLLHPENNTEEEMNSKGGRHRRINLVYFSKLHPELVNARFTGPYRKTAKMWSQNVTNGLFQVLPFEEKIPAEKYYTIYQTHIVMGGYGAAFRTATILKQGIAVIMQDFPYQEWFTPLMKPFVHYIPLEENLSNLNDTLQWVRDNPSKVFDIAMNGKLFYDEYLSYDRMGEFYYELLFRLMLCCGRQDKENNDD